MSSAYPCFNERIPTDAHERDVSVPKTACTLREKHHRAGRTLHRAHRTVHCPALQPHGDAAAQQPHNYSATRLAEEILNWSVIEVHLTLRDALPLRRCIQLTRTFLAARLFLETDEVATEADPVADAIEGRQMGILRR